jgi:hypothetical protein
MDFIFIAVSRWVRVAIAMNDAAQQRRVCKFVARRSAPIATARKRLRQLRATATCPSDTIG